MTEGVRWLVGIGIEGVEEEEEVRQSLQVVYVNHRLSVYMRLSCLEIIAWTIYMYRYFQIHYERTEEIHPA